MASLTLYISIWTGLIIMGVLLYPEYYTGVYNSLSGIYGDPNTGIVKIFESAFTGPAAGLLFGLLAGGVVVVVATFVLGGGFSLLFAYPLVIVFAVTSIYVLPTQMILGDMTIPAEFKMIYILILGGLTILTALTFTAGRN